MVNVRSIAEMGAYGNLLEYCDIEGMILLSELSRRRIRSINKLIRVGRQECVVVIRVDKDKGYIDLSKRRVSPEEIVKCEAKFANAKTVNSILRHVGELMGYRSDEELEALYEKTAWFFDSKYNTPGFSFEVFKHAVQNPAVLDELQIDEETRKCLYDNICRRLTPTQMKLRADIEVQCTYYDGVDAVKRALKKGLEFSTENMPIKINLIAPPLYVITTSTLDRHEGLEKLGQALEAIKAEILAASGSFHVQKEARIVSDTDDLELEKQLLKLQEANEEIAGDDDSEEEGEESEEDEEGKGEKKDNDEEEDGEDED